jgi:spore maturation protein CgeB
MAVVDVLKAPRVLIGGDWKWPIYEDALASGFREVGWEVFEFRQPAKEDALGFSGVKLRLAPSLRGVNARFLETIARVLPDIVFLQRCDLIVPESLRAVREISSKTVVFQFHNDDPFVGLKTRFKFRHFLRSLCLADAALVFRPVNVEDARRYGARVVEILPPYYVKDLHYPVSDRVIDYDLVFIGHYEPDGRAQTIEALVSAGLRLGLHGTHWDLAPRSCSWIRSQNVGPARGDDYRRTLSRAKMALVLLSKQNRDVWTTRSFEIPACRVAMLTPDNPYMRTLFSEDEAIYYQEGDVSELVKKAVEWSQDPERCDLVAEAGWRRCMRDGHSETDRARQVIALWKQIRDSPHSVRPRAAAEST